MQKMQQREVSLCQQTGALLHKNLLMKWRNKKKSLQEWLLCIAVLLIVLLLTETTWSYRITIPDMPENMLGRLDDFNASDRKIGYTPKTQSTQQIMEKVALKLNKTGARIEDFKDEDALEEEAFHSNAIGIVFKDSFSYDLRFFEFQIPVPYENFGSYDTCLTNPHYCSAAMYWHNGFVFLQASIDAAIIEVSTNHSVWEEMMSTVGVLRKFKETHFIDPFTLGVFIVMFSMAFFPLLYFLTLNVAREKATLKDLLCMMGLSEFSFWLSWLVLYSAYICIMAILQSVIAKHTLFSDSSLLVIFLLFFLYGLSSICFCFLLISLLRKPKLTSIVGFLLTLTFGCLSLILLVEDLPPVVMWVFSVILTPCAFSTGLSQMVLLENDKEGVQLNNLTEGPYPLVGVFFILVFNALFYMLLAMYFDKVLPSSYGKRQSPLFFLKSCFQSKAKPHGLEPVTDNEDSSGAFTSDYIEPVPSEFHGKEAIKIQNIKKTFKEEGIEVQALRGLLFDVYEGQITALLGHSGAGKTTLLNILSGLSPPSDGVVSIYQHTLSDLENSLQSGRKTIGFCPQSNIKFDILTVKENLKLFAKVRGIPSKEVEREVLNVLNGLDITNIQDTRAANLSGGQQRKLTLGIAILGNPQILLLDEPTAGLDPCSRHHVWNLLKERKVDRVTLFSTQFMDEADILADRKAVLSAGRLKCVGSSMFLKRKWGIGYHLRMHVTESCNPEQITSVVKYHIPNARLSRQHKQEMIYTLPLDNVDSFPELFSDLDTHSSQEITNYGVSMTTLEDVFLKLEGEKAIEQADYRVFGEECVEEEREGEATDEMEQSLLSLMETGNATVSGTALWRQQVLAIARIRFLKIKHETKTIRSIWIESLVLQIALCTVSGILIQFSSLILISLIFILPVIIHICLHNNAEQFAARELTPNLYLLHTGEQPYKRFSNLLIQKENGSDVDGFIHSVRSQDISVDVMGREKANEDLPHNLALTILRDEQDYRFTLMTTVRAVNGFPVLMNIISNAFLKSFNATERIQIRSNLYMEYHSLFYWPGLFSYCLSMIGLLATGFSPYLGMSSVHDDKIRARSQLRLSGLIPSAYWCGQAMVDIPVMWLLLTLMTATVFIINYPDTLTAWGWTAMILTMTGYSVSIILLVYVISFVCRKGRNNPDFWACIFLVVTIFTLFVEVVSDRVPVASFLVPLLLNLLVPVYPLLSCMKGVELEHEAEIEELDYKRQNMFKPIMATYLHCIVFILLLRCLEKRYGKKTFRGDPFFSLPLECIKSIGKVYAAIFASEFRLSNLRIMPQNDKVFPNLDELEGDDASVHDERTRVQEMIAGQRTEESSSQGAAIVASTLRKEYKDKKASSVFRKKKRAATRNVSFCVKKGEILGLLGPNGAGKSTTIRMLSGDIKPTAGQVLITGVESAGIALQKRLSESTGFLGYCPQENPLWPSLTVKEHLEVYAAIKGMRKEDAAAAIKRITDALELNEDLKKAARKLSEGVKRKVCFALSMLANPTVVLLDEPSTGMDPKGQQRVWRAIRAAFKNKERGAILTTHYMEEAEAVCDRVAIMVSGKLRCIGSIQQLKSKFGKGYFLEVKVRDPQQVDALHMDILKIFPLAARQERFSSLLSYKIPMENVKSLSQAFSVLEEVKRTFDLEEYSFSQSTLEQVFIELTKEQEKDEFDLALDATFDWKKLQEEDA